MLLPMENVRFVFGPTPLLLVSAAPIHDVLPVLHAPNGNMPTCSGWQVMARLTMCLVDGPGDAGCLIPTLAGPDSSEEMADWCGAVASAGGAVVVSLETMPEQIDWNELFTAGLARGGFVRSVDALPQGQA